MTTTIYKTELISFLSKNKHQLKITHKVKMLQVRINQLVHRFKMLSRVMLIKVVKAATYSLKKSEQESMLISSLLLEMSETLFQKLLVISLSSHLKKDFNSNFTLKLTKMNN